MRRVYILPNLFTAASLFCGLLAIFEVLRASDSDTIVWACQLVLIAGILDLFDGVIARLTRTQSSFGLNFDSLADLIAFGAAPVLIAYTVIPENHTLIANATCALFVICGALRLARFNVQAGREEKRTFTGLPIPAAGCLLVSLFWVLIVRPDLDPLLPTGLILPPMVLLAYLMVSNFPYYSIKSVQLSTRQPFESLVKIVTVLALLMALRNSLDVLLLVAFGTYSILGPVQYFYRQRRRIKSKSPSTAELNDRPRASASRDSSSR